MTAVRERPSFPLRRLGRRSLAGLLIVAILVVWELVVRAQLVNPLLFEPTSAILASFLDGWAEMEYPAHVWPTTKRFLVGFAAALAVAIPVGVVVGRIHVVARYVLPLVHGIYPIPITALIPFASALLGFTDVMYASLVAIAAGIPTMLGTIDSSQRVDRVSVESARTLGSNEWRVFTRVVLPASLPGILTAVYVASAIGVVVLIAAEIVAGSTGIGGLILRARRQLRVDDMYAGILLAACFGFLVATVVGRTRVLLVRWHASQRAKRW